MIICNCRLSYFSIHKNAEICGSLLLILLRIGWHCIVARLNFFQSWDQSNRPIEFRLLTKAVRSSSNLKYSMVVASTN